MHARAALVPGRRCSLATMTVIKVESVERLGRGGGVVTIPLITRQSAEEENRITTGISVYPAGSAFGRLVLRDPGHDPEPPGVRLAGVKGVVDAVAFPGRREDQRAVDPR